MRDCGACKDWKGCIKEGPFSYSEIRFCRVQMFWLIEWLDALSMGYWPDEGRRTDASGVSGTFGLGSYFAKACGMAGFVEFRLKKTGVDGKLLKAQIEGGKYIIEQLQYEARRALNYISGWRRKKESYRNWCRKREFVSKDAPK